MALLRMPPDSTLISVLSAAALTDSATPRTIMPPLPVLTMVSIAVPPDSTMKNVSRYPLTTVFFAMPPSKTVRFMEPPSSVAEVRVPPLETPMAVLDPLNSAEVRRPPSLTHTLTALLNLARLSASVPPNKFRMPPELRLTSLTMAPL